MTYHAGRLSAVSFLRNQGVGQTMYGPSHGLMTLYGGVVETHVCEIEFHSAGSDGHRIGRHNQTHQSGLHPVSDVGNTRVANSDQPRTLQTVRARFTGAHWGRRQGERNL